MTGFEDDGKCMLVHCSQGRIKVLIFIVVLSMCGAGLATYFVIKDRFKTEDPIINGSRAQNSSTEDNQDTTTPDPYKTTTVLTSTQSPNTTSTVATSTPTPSSTARPPSSDPNTTTSVATSTQIQSSTGRPSSSDPNTSSTEATSRQSPNTSTIATWSQIQSSTGRQPTSDHNTTTILATSTQTQSTTARQPISDPNTTTTVAPSAQNPNTSSTIATSTQTTSTSARPPSSDPNTTSTVATSTPSNAIINPNTTTTVAPSAQTPSTTTRPPSSGPNTTSTVATSTQNTNTTTVATWTQTPSTTTRPPSSGPNTTSTVATSTQTPSTSTRPPTSGPSTTSTVATSTQTPSTSTRPPTSAISFELSKTEVYIGESGLSMTCNVSNYQRLTRVEITSRLGMIANVTQPALYTSISGVNIYQGSFVNETNASVKVGITYNLKCNDSGMYTCKAIGNSTISSSINLTILRKPSKPTLVVPREIVEGKNTRDDLPFTCEADVGFPAGNLVLQSNFTSSFNPYLRTNNVTISNETCQAYQKITFAFIFFSNWHNTEMLCFAVNNKSLDRNVTPPFDKQLVQVVPANYCPTTERRLLYHPYNCHYFVDCVNGVESVNMCPANLCFGVNETTECSYCNQSLCAATISNQVCPGSNAEPLPYYPGLSCSLYVNCTDRLVHECPSKQCFNVSSKTCSDPSTTTTVSTSTQIPSTTAKPPDSVITFELSKTEVYIGESGLSMTCNVSNYQRLTRVEITSKRGIIANVTQPALYTSISGVNIYQGSFVNETKASVKVGITNNLTCNDSGMYICKAIGNTTTSSSAILAIFGEPNTPTLTLSPWIEENKTTFADRMFRCEGLVGKPDNQMFVEANVSSTFQKYDFPYVINNTEVGCNTNQKYEFSYAFNMSWHGRSIRCAVENTKTNVTVRSQPKQLEIVPRNYCADYKEDTFLPHPYECNKFIRCLQNNIIGIDSCVPGSCFGVNQTLFGGCNIYCSDKNLMCRTGARKP